MKRKTPSKLEQQVHVETGGRIDYDKIFYGAVYPNQSFNPKAPAFIGKCTLTLNGQETELEVAIWKRDYGLSLQGTLITLVDGLPTAKQKREYE